MGQLRDEAARRILYAWLWEQVNAELYVESGGQPPSVPKMSDEELLDYLRGLLGLQPLHDPWAPASVQFPVFALFLLVLWALGMTVTTVILLVKLAV